MLATNFCRLVGGTPITQLAVPRWASAASAAAAAAADDAAAAAAMLPVPLRCDRAAADADSADAATHSGAGGSTTESSESLLRLRRPLRPLGENQLEMVDGRMLDMRDRTLWMMD